MDCVVLLGGFSYGDYLRAGLLLASHQLRKRWWSLPRRAGWYWGSATAQILLEVGLLPGAMQRNRDLAFICSDVHLTVENRNSAACGSVPVDQTVLRIPIAHMEGNYTVDDATLKAMEARGQVLFRYCSENGELGEAFNPNGSVSHIAGIQTRQEMCSE